MSLAEAPPTLEKIGQKWSGERGISAIGNGFHAEISSLKRPREMKRSAKACFGDKVPKIGGKVAKAGFGATFRA